MNLIGCDIITWNGVICRYASIRPFVVNGDVIHRATHEQVTRYLKIQTR